MAHIIKPYFLNTLYIKRLFFLIFCCFLLSSCANQLPPGGGEEDKEPPKLVSQYPPRNTLNYRGKSITLKFDKYVDRRSLQDAFFISPPMGNDVEFDWSGKEVEIKYPKSFGEVGPNKTFVVTVNSTLKDIHGNSLTPPISFAFSTGNKIDKAGISGYVVNNDGKLVSVFAYKLTGVDSEYNPTKKFADYISETTTNGDYKLSNLGPGLYRVISVSDEDKNLLYTADREDYGVLSRDILINDSENISGINFYLKKVSGQSEQQGPDISLFYRDSIEAVFTSIENESKTVLPDQSIFIYFNKYKPSREDFVKSFALKDAIGNPIKNVFNWVNDSLVEVFPSNKFELDRSYNLSFKLNKTKDSTYDFTMSFSTVSHNSFGEMKGAILNKNITDSLPVVVQFELTTKTLRPEVKYVFSTADSTFNFKNMVEADYTLFSYIDLNMNNKFDYGKAYPFECSEPFFLYPHDISIRGGWAVEDVMVDFKR